MLFYTILTASIEVNPNQMPYSRLQTTHYRLTAVITYLRSEETLNIPWEFCTLRWPWILGITYSVLQARYMYTGQNVLNGSDSTVVTKCLCTLVKSWQRVVWACIFCMGASHTKIKHTEICRLYNLYYMLYVPVRAYENKVHEYFQ